MHGLNEIQNYLISHALGVGLSAVGGILLTIWIVGSLKSNSRKRAKLLKKTATSNTPEVINPAKADEQSPKIPGVASRPFQIAGIATDPNLPCKHIFIAATTGAGKTQVLHTCLDRVLWGCDHRPGMEKALITDPSGSFYSTRGGKDDLILNPFDARTVDWSPFSEIREESDWDMLARAVMPDSPIPQKQEWVEYGRSLLVDVMRQLQIQGKADVRTVSNLVVRASIDELSEYLVNTESEILVHPGSEKLLQSVRFQVGDGIRAWRYLNPEGKFSIRDWVDHGTGAMFLTYQESQFDSMRPLVGAWLSLAIRQTLSLSEDFDRRVWFVMDELDSLGKVDFLKDALARGRKYGLACISTIQTISQEDATYGHDTSKTLRSNHVSKIIMKQGSNEDAEYWSKEIGDEEKWMDAHSTGTSTGGPMGMQSSSGTNSTLQVRRSVLGSELMALPERTGFAILADRPNIVKFSIPLTKYPKKNEPFIKKEG